MSRVHKNVDENSSRQSIQKQHSTWSARLSGSFLQTTESQINNLRTCTRQQQHDVELHTYMNENYPLLERHFRLHSVCSTVECPGCLRTVHDTTILQILENIFVESFDVFCDGITDLPQRANDTLEPRKPETSCKVDDFVGRLFIPDGGMTR
ncbi:hypothetical protein BDR05DRAFT_1047901 [Suillus weaverae]|nr:hypothetical protein BDR05DRAFT_1047901 [Suillus weaverae]